MTLTQDTRDRLKYGLTSGAARDELALILDLLNVNAASNSIQSTAIQAELAANGITAFATGGQTNGTVLAAQVNRISVCATAGDSVKLMSAVAALAGTQVVVINDGAASCNVFPFLGDTINGQAANASYALAAGSTITFSTTVAGAWQTVGPNTTPAKFTLVATAGPYTALAGELTGAAYVTAQYSGIAGSTLTVRTAAQMIADGGYKVGQSYFLRIINSNGATATLTTAAGVTLTGHVAITTNTFVDYVVTITGAAAMTFQSVGSGVSP